jgi:hypothetical protein
LAHEIAVVNGKTSMTYVDAVPWHGIGQGLTEGEPTEVRLAEARLTTHNPRRFPMPRLNIKEGEQVRMRLIPSFHIRSGLISRENVHPDHWSRERLSRTGLPRRNKSPAPE